MGTLNMPPLIRIKLFLCAKIFNQRRAWHCLPFRSQHIYHTAEDTLGFSVSMCGSVTATSNSFTYMSNVYGFRHIHVYRNTSLLNDSSFHIYVSNYEY